MNDTDENQKKGTEDADENITFEPDTDSDNTRDATAVFASLKEKLKSCQKERQEYLDGWQRMKADFINAKKREGEERTEFVKFSKEEIVRDLLPVMTSFHTAFGNKETWEKADLNWRMGVQYIYSQLRSALERHGIALIEPNIGELFDGEKYETVGVLPVAEKEKDHTVLVVIAKGYALHGKILEPAKVKVGEYTDKSEAQNPKSETNLNDQNQK